MEREILLAVDGLRLADAGEKPWRISFLLARVMRAPTPRLNAPLAMTMNFGSPTVLDDVPASDLASGVVGVCLSAQNFALR